MIYLIDPGHGVDTAGKRSPDGLLREYAWARDVAQRIAVLGQSRGMDVRLLVSETHDVPLRERVRRVNDYVRRYGRDNVVLVSVHVNASGNGSEWGLARGFSVFVSANASQASRELAQAFTHLARERRLLGNRFVPAENYWVQSLAMTRDTLCPAVLTENLFMDNRDDCAWLVSEAGRDAIARLHVDALERWKGAAV